MIYIIILSAILLPLFAKNKPLALIGSMLILFIPWGMQYEMVNDWPGNLERWRLITRYLSKDIVDGSGRELEGIYVYLVKFFKDFGFFGWLMLSAVFNLSIIYLLTRKYVPKEYYWVVIFILMIRINYGFLFINSNRQSFAVFTTVVASLVLCNENFKNFFLRNIYTRILLAIGLILMAKNMHSSAIFAFAMIPLYLIAKNVKKLNLWLIAIVNVLFFARFVFNADVLQDRILMYMDMIGVQDVYDSYITLLDTKRVQISTIENIIYFSIMNAALFMYNKFSTPIKYFALCTVLSIILGGFMTGNLGRICQY